MHGVYTNDTRIALVNCGRLITVGSEARTSFQLEGREDTNLINVA